jgi:antitoxin CcdA
MRLADWMAKEGVSAAELARRCGVHLGTVSEWKAGTKFPRPALLRLLLAAGGGAVTANDFAGIAAKRAGCLTDNKAPHPGRAETQAPYAEASALGLDADAIAEQALREAIRAEKAQRWLEENRAAIEAGNRWHAENPLPLAPYRMF